MTSTSAFPQIPNQVRALEQRSDLFTAFAGASRAWDAWPPD